MAEPHSTLPDPGPGLARGPAARPGPWLNALLFLATLASVLVTGAALASAAGQPFRLANGVPFTAALLGILVTHEMAHYLFARRHRVDTSLPYFIPMPLFSPAGTLGAVIVMRSRIATRDALVDVGASGPLAGFVVAVGVLAYGLAESRPVPVDPAALAGLGAEGWLGLPASSALNLAHELWLALSGGAATTGQVRSEFMPILADPLVVRLLRPLAHGPLPPDHDLLLSPVAFAGWFGMLVTALNLMPVGQLDGGHIAYAAFGQRHAHIGRAVRWALVGLGLFLYSGWLVWALVTRFVGTRHPPVDDEGAPMHPLRKAACWASLIVFALTFMPAPIR